jgi:hypothetical protein
MNLFSLMTQITKASVIGFGYLIFRLNQATLLNIYYLIFKISKAIVHHGNAIAQKEFSLGFGKR